jgi:hypothetical protein
MTDELGPGQPGHGAGGPHVRVQPTGWILTATGWKVTGYNETGVAELICGACGDDGGPWEEQTVAIRELRGPYTSIAAGITAAREHAGLVG